MLKSVYDINNNGIVDTSENALKVNNHTVLTDVPANALFTDTIYDDTNIVNSLNNKVDKITGKGLSTNDFTTTLKDKLDGIENNANNYTLPKSTSSTLGGVTIGSNLTINDGTLSLTSTNIVDALGYTPASSVSDTALYLKPPAEAGFNSDQYGNLKHKRTGADDNWQLQKNDGTALSQYYWEKGIWTANQFRSSTGGSWIAARDKATVRNNSYGQAAGNQFNVLASQKTTNGAWCIGNLSGDNNLYLSYTTDANYNAGTNQSTNFTINTSGYFNGSCATANNAINTITRSGTTFTATRVNGTTFTFTQQDNNTTYSAGTGLSLSSTTFNLARTNLYNNTSGSNGTITLSQTAANFNYIIIYFYSQYNNDYGSWNIWAPNGKSTVIHWLEVAGANSFNSDNFFHMGRRIKINGTSIATYNDQYGLTANTGGYCARENRCIIYRVDGYK